MYLRWLDSSAEEAYNPSLILKNKELLAALKGSPNLRNLFIQFADQYFSDSVSAMKCNTKLKGFKNLTSLELYQFYDEESQLVKNIANVLWDCPGLKKLGLGMACEFYYDAYPEVLVINSDCDFLEKLCLLYGTRSSPLALETLKLGNGLFIYESRSAAGNYLAKLVNVQDIRTLHIFNGPINDSDDRDDVASMKVHWDFFAECKSLNQLSVSRLDNDVRKWLNAGGNSVQELFITEHYSVYDRLLDNFDLLKLPQLSMLFTRERTVRRLEREDAWSDIDSLDSDEDMQDSDSANESMLDRYPITVLDRLYDQGANLTQLGLCVELETQWVSYRA